MLLSLSAIEYTEEPSPTNDKYTVPVIHMVCHREDGTLQIVKVLNFRPYFYIKERDFPRVSDIIGHCFRKRIIDQEVFQEGWIPMLKVYTSIPRMVKRYRDMIEARNIESDEEYKKKKIRTYEANVLFPLRFLIEAGIYSGIDYDPLTGRWSPADVPSKMRTWILDIEVLSPEPGIPDTEKAKWPVNVIGILGFPDGFSSGTRGCQLVYDPKQRPELNPAETERGMLEELLQFIEEDQPAIITGHNIHWDLSYLIHRMKRLGLDPKRLSPIGVWTYRDGEVKIHGRSIMNGQDLLTSFYKKEFPGSGFQSLGDIAPIFGIQKMELPEGQVYRQWEIDPQIVLDYNMRDLECVEAYLTRPMNKLSGKHNIINFFIALKNTFGTRLEDSVYNSRLVDVLLLREYHNKQIFPTSGDEEYTPYEGAIVFDAPPGVYKNVGQLDIKSSYPTAIVAFNISPEVFDPEMGDLRISDTIAFSSKKKGIIPTLIEKAIKNRQRIQAERKVALKAGNVDQAQALEYAAFAWKTLINAIYGVLKFKNFRLKSRVCGEAIAAVARMALTNMKETVEKYG